MIENNIWQTYECSYEELPEYAKQATYTWKKQNPTWIYNYMSGKDREDFFKQEYSSEIYDTYMRLPLGVMKAGLWRFGILYRMGGVYSDIDTSCNVSIENWYNPIYDMMLDIERDTPFFATQTIASAKDHPILLNSINMCVERMKNFEQFNHMVHYYTDCSMFTESICQFLGVEPYIKHLNTWYKELNELEISKKYKIFIFGGNDARRLLDKDITHFFWGDVGKKSSQGYIAWKEDPRVNDPNNKRGLSHNRSEWE